MKIQLFFLATIFSTISSLVSFAQQPEIGSFYQGGIVFQLDGEGGGLVCDIQDLNLAQWGCHGTDISGAEGIAIGSGQQNTNEILNGCSQSGIAARLCDNSTSQGFDDWFLPSKDEFMAIDISLVNSASLANGGSTFNYTAPPGSFGMGGAYLTSSEMGDSYPTSYVYGVNISESFFGEEVEMYTTNFSKNEYYYVRAIRAITIYGCIDPAASNYNTSANTDDGSCIVYGCVEPTALNYNSSANTDDGSCSGVGLKTYVPDDNFEWYLEINGMGDGVYNNDSVYTANIHTVTLLDIALDPMDFSMTIIFDLTGIEDFSSLKYLYCDNNLISSLDLSNNFSLTSLECVGNQISNINVNNCTQLSLLRCGENPISSLDLSTNSNLNELYCYGTQIQSLDVGNCSSLSTLYCHDNPQLSSLNLRNGNNTNMFLRADLNPSLSCINVDGMYNDVSWAISNWTACYCATWQGFGNIDSHHTFSTSCGSVFGCIDSLSCNYDSSATADDGSCLTIYGCMDNSSCNYNSEATCDDESCYGLLGCTDPSAPNYNLSATCDDELCVSAVLGCMDFSASNYNPLANIEDGSCVLYGCMTNTAFNYNPLANTDDESCISVIFGCTDVSASNYDPLANTNDRSCEYLGCIDISASNYDASANTNDGSCEYPGCTNISASNYDASANTDDGSCCVYGCTDPTALNYNSLATCNDGSCGCTPIYVDNYSYSWAEEISWLITDCDGNELTAGDAWGEECYDLDLSAGYIVNIYDSFGDGWNGTILNVGSDTYTLVGSMWDFLNEFPDDGSSAQFIIGCPDISGCIYEAATNYNSDATVDDGSCEFDIPSCMDEDADNYNADATEDDGSCEYLGCTDVSASNYDASANTDDGFCCVDGCTESTALNYNSLATCNDASCIAIVLGCTDSSSSNYNPAANTNYNCCVDGCSESTALNYNSLATCDDGTCEYDVLGCTDESANNYNSQATVDDGSCQHAPSNQIISLVSGWSSFSSYINPEVSSIDIVLSEIYENVIMVKDYLGQAYLPDWNFNAIGDLNHHQGYQIKIAQEDTLNIQGTYVLPEENPNDLPSGWFMMGYLRLEGVPMDLLLADLVEEQYITIVKDYLGQAYLPDWNFNAIGDAKPGFGYHIKTTQECTLEYLPNNLSYRLSSSLKVIENKSSYFPRATVTDNNMTLIIEDRAWDVLPNQNSEIQALDSENNIVGSVLYTSPTTIITLWGDDKYTSRKDGLDINEQVQLKLWDREEITGFVIKDWVKGSSAYQINAINIASSIITENSTLEANDIGTKSLVRIINLLGQEVHQENIERTVQFLFKVYDDGSVERFIK